MICSACGNEMNSGARFCSNCGRPSMAVPPVTQTAPPTAVGYTNLFRPRAGRAIAGVCAGFALHYGWDVVLVRILLAVIVVFGCGTPILAYFVAWIVMPNEPLYLSASTSTAGSV
ncbi:MAG: PspC domain-containing protein [Acidobacteria bacterium]|nr:PspC domain-containing protein [Acidobacteriota bacterium]